MITQVENSGPISLRDYFAAQAMIALMSSDRWVRTMNSHAAAADREFKAALAQHSWAMADAMLAARGEGGAA